MNTQKLLKIGLKKMNNAENANKCESINCPFLMNI